MSRSIFFTAAFLLSAYAAQADAYSITVTRGCSTINVHLVNLPAALGAGLNDYLDDLPCEVSS